MEAKLRKMREKHPVTFPSSSEEDLHLLSRSDHREGTDSSCDESVCSNEALHSLISNPSNFSARVLFQEEPAAEEGATREKERTRGRKGASKVWLILGYVFGVMAMLCIAVSAGCAQALGGYVPEFELNAFRFSIGFFISLPGVVGLKLDVIPDRKTFAWLMLFCMIAVTYNVGFFGAAIYLPVATLGGLEATLMILSTAIISSVMTKQCHVPTLVCVILCATGAILLTQPRFLFSHIVPVKPVTTHPVCFKEKHFSNKITFLQVEKDTIDFNLSSLPNASSMLRDFSSDGIEISGDLQGYLLLLLAAASSTSHIFLLKSPLKHMNVFVILFWQGLSGTVVSIIVTLVMEKPMFPENITCMVITMGQGLGISFATPLLFASMLLVPPIMYAVLNTLTLLFLLGAQYTVLKNVNSGFHNSLEVTGAAAVFVGNLVGPAYRLYTDLSKDGDNEDIENSKDRGNYEELPTKER